MLRKTPTFFTNTATLQLHTHACSLAPRLPFSHTPTAKHAHSKSAWINKRWSCAHSLISQGKKTTKKNSSPHISPGEWVGHCWLPENQFVSLLSWCLVCCYSSFQPAHPRHAPLNGIYKTWDVLSSRPPPPPLYMTELHASVTMLHFVRYGGALNFPLNTRWIHPSSSSWCFDRWNKLCFLNTLAYGHRWAPNLEVLKSVVIM